MRIVIKEKDKRAIKIIFPNFIINVGLRIAMKCMKVAVTESHDINMGKNKYYSDDNIDKNNIKQGLKEYIVNEVNQKSDEEEINETNSNKRKGKVYFGFNEFQGIDKKILKQALKELKKYKGLEIFNVESKDEKVSITI